MAPVDNLPETGLPASRRPTARALVGAAAMVLFILAAPGFQPLASAQAGIGLEVGDRVGQKGTPGQWQIVNVVAHPEFVRYEVESRDERSVVEVIARDGRSGPFVTEHYLIQPAPGESPSRTLLGAFRKRIEELEEVSSADGPRLRAIGKGRGPGPNESRGDIRHLILGTPPLYGAVTPYAATVVIAFFVYLAAWLVYRLRRVIRSPPRIQARDFILPCGVAMVGFGFLYTVHVPFRLHNDTVRDMSIARDCLEGLGCHAGAVSSFGGLFQGTLLARLIALSTGAGISLDTLQILFLLSMAAAASMVSNIARRMVSPVAAAVAAAIFLGLVAPDAFHGVLWNPILLPVALSAFYLSLFATVRHGTVPAVMVSGFMLAIAMESHLICICLIPIFAAFTVLCSSRPLLAAPAGLLVAISTTAWLSPGTFGTNVSRGLTPTVLLVSGLACVAMVAVAARLRPTWESMSPEMRSRVALYSWLAFTLGIGVSIPLYFDIKPAFRYVAPSFPLLAVAAADLPERFIRSSTWQGWHAPRGKPRRTTILVGFIILTATLITVRVGARLLHEVMREREGTASWSLADAVAVAEHIHDGTVTYGELRTRLHGPQSRSLIAAMGLFEPPSSKGGPSPTANDTADSEDLLVMKVPAARPGARRLEKTDRVQLDGKWVALVRRYRSWIGRTNIEICDRALPREGNRTPEWNCVTSGLDEWRQGGRGMGKYRYRAYPSIGVPRTLSRSEGYELRYRMPITIEGTDRARVVHIREPFRGHGECGWRIRNVRGVPHGGALPGGVVRLDNRGAKRGTIDFTTSVDNALCRGSSPSFPPPLVETAVEERYLRRVLGLPESGP